MGKVMTQRYGVPYQVVAHDAIFRVLLGPVTADQQASLLEQIRQGAGASLHRALMTGSTE